MLKYIRLSLYVGIIFSLSGGLSPTFADNLISVPSVGAEADGSSQVSVSVTYTYGSPGGGSTSTTVQEVAATVHPVCWFKRKWTGEQVADAIENKKVTALYFGTHGDPAFWYADWEKHRNEDGYWHDPACSIEYAADKEQGERIMDSFFGNESPVWVPAGYEPPEPVVDGKALAQAAWQVVDIPAPTVDYNPSLGNSGATLVGWETWVWATGETPTSVQATATVGSNTATVTAVASGLDLAAPSADPQCAGFGVPWSPEMQHTDCSIVFTRSSAHLGGTTPMRVSVAYHATYDASDGSSGNLGTTTTTSTHHVPVAEAQTLNSNPNN